MLTYTMHIVKKQNRINALQKTIVRLRQYGWQVKYPNLSKACHTHIREVILELRELRKQ